MNAPVIDLGAAGGHWLTGKVPALQQGLGVGAAENGRRDMAHQPSLIARQVELKRQVALTLSLVRCLGVATACGKTNKHWHGLATPAKIKAETAVGVFNTFMATVKIYGINGQSILKNQQLFLDFRFAAAAA